MAEKKDQVAKETATDKAKKPAVKKATQSVDASEAKQSVAEKKAETVKKAVAEKPAVKKETVPKAEKTAPVAKKAEVTPKAEKTEVKKAEPAKKVEVKKAETPKKAVVQKEYVTDGSVRGRLKARFKKEVVPALMAEKGYKNVNEVPALVKIVINARLGDIKDNSKSIALAQKEIDAITGQKSVIVKAKKSVANFKLRENQPIGIKVTLRGDRMYEFFDKLITIALPRVRDFRGISGKSFDGRGNYAMGVKEQIVFPEISYETVEKVRGFDVCIVTTAKSDDESKALLTKLGMPFKN